MTPDTKRDQLAAFLAMRAWRHEAKAARGPEAVTARPGSRRPRLDDATPGCHAHRVRLRASISRRPPPP